MFGRLAVCDAMDISYRFIALHRASSRTQISGLTDHQKFRDDGHSAIQHCNPLPLTSARELKTIQKNGTDVQLIDIRGAEVWNLVHIEGATYVPKSRIMS